eukprot:scaffold62141_cov46-Cyclotella_meneghiniana.AAC.2
MVMYPRSGSNGDGLDDRFVGLVLEEVVSVRIGAVASEATCLVVDASAAYCERWEDRHIDTTRNPTTIESNSKRISKSFAMKEKRTADAFVLALFLLAFCCLFAVLLVEVGVTEKGLISRDL